MKPLAALLVFLYLLCCGCESTTTEENFGYGMEFSETGDSDEAKVIE